MSLRGSPDGAKRITDANGNLIDAAVRLGIDAINNAFSGGTNSPNPKQIRALDAAGYEFGAYRGGEFVEPPKNGKFVPVWQTPTGELIGQNAARLIARDLIRNPPPPPPPPKSPDAAGVPAIPLPPIPGLPPSIPIPPVIVGAASGQILPAVIAGTLFWPTAAGRGSDLRDLYGMPAPAAKPGSRRRGRRPRARARPRALPGRGNPFPAAGVKGRGGPVTVARPRVVAPPKAVAVPAKMPRPRVLAGSAGTKIEVGPIKASPPAKIPTTRAQQAVFAAQRILGLPFVKDALQGALSAGIGSLFAKSPEPRVGRVTLPNTGSNPLPMPSPLTASNPLALTYARPLAATNAATQEQDCTCRPARKKRKKKACKNPVTSRRSFKRGGKRFVTTTKEMKCRA